MNKTDLRIAKLWRKGNHSLASIARRIGNPGDLKRVKDALIRERIINENKILTIIKGHICNWTKWFLKGRRN